MNEGAGIPGGWGPTPLEAVFRNTIAMAKAMGLDTPPGRLMMLARVLDESRYCPPPEPSPGRAATDGGATPEAD